MTAPETSELVDTNVYLGRWPFRRLPHDDPAELVTLLKRQGVTQAWAGSFDGLFHRDLTAVNDQLVKTCAAQGAGLLVPFGSINPRLPDWEEDLRRCREVHGMIGIRLHPNYHGYTLGDEPLAKLLSAATEQDLIVQLVVSMEDERTQSPVFRVPHVDCKPLAGLMKDRSNLRLIVLNAFRKLTPLQAGEIAQAGPACFDIAMLEGVAGVGRLVKEITAERVVFGSLAPLFYWESALLKLRESELAGFQVAAIRAGNARRLIAGK